DSLYVYYFFFSSRRRHTRSKRDWSSDVCSSDLGRTLGRAGAHTGTALVTGSEGEESAVADVNSGTKSGAGGERLTGEQARAWIIALADRVADGAGELTDLDRRAGAGDLGWNPDTALWRGGRGLA